jgi:hypothetical protein
MTSRIGKVGCSNGTLEKSPAEQRSFFGLTHLPGLLVGWPVPLSVPEIKKSKVFFGHFYRKFLG